VCKQKWFV